jgi:outer membrane biosynthesis protein TonB
MKRPVVLIVGAAAGALLVAAVGASAHTGFSLTRLVGVHSAQPGDEATGARTESPEPSESPEPTEVPEASPTPEPSEAPEPADNEDEAGEDNDDQGENQPAAQPTSSGEHDGGDGGHDD